MKRSTLAWGAGLLLLLTLGILAAALAETTAGPSVLSSGAQGWLAARRYLEARGIDATVHDRPLADDQETPVWITAFPWQQAPLLARLDPIRDFVRQGGTLLLGYSGAADGDKEGQLLELLGAPRQRVGPEPPLSPLAWWRFQKRQWTLVPADPGSKARRGRISAGSALPQPPAGARILFRLAEQDGEPAAAMTFSVGGGRVVLFPSEALSNARLAEPGNADLLETLIAFAPSSPWAFDEFAHGLQPASGAGGLEAPRVAFDLFAGHLALLYLLTLVVLARRFGPPWRDPPVRAGSAATFLRGLGSLHHRFGHHRRAAELLLERTQALDPRRQISPEVASLAVPGDARALLRLARALARTSAASTNDSKGSQ